MAGRSYLLFICVLTVLGVCSGICSCPIGSPKISDGPGGLTCSCPATIAVAVGIVIILLTCASTLVCYCCNCCCFRKTDTPLIIHVRTVEAPGTGASSGNIN